MEDFKLSRAYLRPETEPGYEKAMWRPTWKCFCCQDLGLVKDHLIKKVIDGYNPVTDKQVICNATNCQSKQKYSAEDLVLTGTLDTRFPSWLCDRFDLEEREMWQEWRQKQHYIQQEKLNSIDTESVTKNLRNGSRSNCEQLEQQRRHQRIIDEY